MRAAQEIMRQKNIKWADMKRTIEQRNLPGWIRKIQGSTNDTKVKLIASRWDRKDGGKRLLSRQELMQALSTIADTSSLSFESRQEYARMLREGGFIPGGQ